LLFSIKIRLFALLTLTFIVMTIIGTLSHECGHLIASKIMGFDARINYESTYVVMTTQKMTTLQSFWMTLAGPLQTMLTGTIGFVFLFKSVKSTERLLVGQWGLVFISLFWLRQSANLITWLIGYFSTGSFAVRGDEIKLSAYLNMSPWYIILLTAIIGFVILGIITFKIVPKSQRFTFILSGLVGGLAGYWLWFDFLGKLIMP
jgi:hypothetical protein